MAELTDEVGGSPERAPGPAEDDAFRSDEHDVVNRLRALHHDLSQPLAAIAAFAEAALADPALPETAGFKLERIVEEAGALHDLCRSVLVRSSEDRPVPLGHLARSVAAGCQAIHDAAIRVDVSAHALVVGQETELRRMVWNVLDNACRAAGSGGQVRIRVSREGDVVSLEVADAGPGFGQAGEGKASLGLAGVGRYVRARGGDLRVATSDLGGALVTVTLPTRSVAFVPPALDA